MNRPDRIWIDLRDETAYSTEPEEGETEYVRADLFPGSMLPFSVRSKP